MGRPPKVSVDLIAEALAKTGGLLGVTAQLLKCERRTIERYLVRYSGLRKIRDDAKEHALDDAEWALIKAAKRGDPWAVQWFLRYQGKRRGYQEATRDAAGQTLRVDVVYSDELLRPTANSTTVRALPAGHDAVEIVEADVRQLEEEAP